MNELTLGEFLLQQLKRPSTAGHVNTTVQFFQMPYQRNATGCMPQAPIERANQNIEMDWQ